MKPSTLTASVLVGVFSSAAFSANTPSIFSREHPKIARAVSNTTGSTSDSLTDGLITNGKVALGLWEDAYNKAVAFANSLNTTEKYALITGGDVTALNFTSLQFKDGAQGVQEYYFVSGFSQAAALAMTWDRQAVYDQARAVASEFYYKGFQVVNGPTSEPLGRTPWGGRLGEAFSPDPYLNGIVFGLSVKAYTDLGIIAGGKHFLLNEQETNRTSSSSGMTGGGGGAPGGMGGMGGTIDSNSSTTISSGGSPLNGTMSGSANALASELTPQSMHVTGSTTNAMSSTATVSVSGTFMSLTVSGTMGTAPTGSSVAMSNSSASSLSNSSASTASSSSDSPPYSSNADDKTIHEAYLWPFYDGVKNGLGAVMCAMTLVNNTASCENSDLLNGLLKTELGFPGMVYPDVNGQKTALGSVEGGLDYGSSSTWSTSTLNEFLSNGSLSDARLNDMVIRNVIGYYHTGLNNGTQPSLATSSEYRDVRADHAKIIRENGAKSIVLLKNTNNALPLDAPKVMSVFGANAGPGIAGPNTAFSVQGAGPTHDGHLGSGSESGEDSLPYLITPQAALTARASQDGTMVRWLMNDTYASSSTGNSLVVVSNGQTAVTPSYASYASGSDVCLVFINALAGEGADRTELYNIDQDDMINAVASNCNNTIVVVTTTGPRLLDQWITNDNVTAVLYSAPLGQESGNSYLDVLYGNVNPSARLTYVLAKNESDYNVDICYTKQCNFTEGVYLDYRSFIQRGVTPRYQFGYGLTYASFEYSALEASSTNESTLSTYASGTLAVGGREDLWDIVAKVSVTTRNTGSVNGTDIPQLYVLFRFAIHTAAR